MTDRPPGFWGELVAATLSCFARARARASGCGSSRRILSELGFSLAPATAHRAGGSEAISTVLITSLGYLGLDVLTSIVAEPRRHP